MWHPPQGRCHSYIRLTASCIALQFYDATHRDIVLRTVWGEYNITKADRLSYHFVVRQNITVRPVSQYHSLTFIFEMVFILKYVTNYDTFN